LKTTGCKDKAAGSLLRDITQTDYFRVVVVDDVETVEVCGALKVMHFVKQTGSYLNLLYAPYKLTSTIKKGESGSTASASIL